MAVTLSPDTKPAGLGANDTGFRIRSTDFDREYRWGGAAWADAPGAPKRKFLQLSIDAPGAGWCLANGVATTISTSTGGTAAYTPPNMDARFPRMNIAASGGTGGSSSHDHPIDPPNRTTTANSGGAITVDNNGDGSTVDVAANGHTHDVDIPSFTSGSVSHLPYYYDFYPYLRL